MIYSYSEILKESMRELMGLNYGYGYCPLKSITGYEKDKKDFKIDKSGVDAWNIANPYCIAREEWERLKYLICEDLGIKPLITSDSCELTVSILTNDLDCSIMYCLSVYKDLCKQGFKISLQRKEINTAHKDFLLHYGNQLDNETYADLVINCNMSPEVIKYIYDNGASTDGVHIITENAKFKISDIEFMKEIKPDKFKYLNNNISLIATNNYVKENI